MKWGRSFFKGIGLGSFLLTGNFLLYLREIPTKTDPLAEEIRGVVVLTGDKGRLETGLALLNSSRRLLISGVHQKVQFSDLPWQEAPSPCRHQRALVTLGRAASNTWENALESALWIQQQGFSAIGLVSSDYHLPRSSRAFTRILPHVQIHPIPVIHPRDKTWYLQAMRESLGVLGMMICRFLEKL
ncbi:MAG: YdcF family protein [Holosporales bacterium]|nr:YdcF family protein [Holosporales bacterium]